MGEMRKGEGGRRVVPLSILTSSNEKDEDDEAGGEMGEKGVEEGRQWSRFCAER